MGGRIARLFRNFNLENRVFRELSKEKPTAAPRHAVPGPPLPGSDVSESVRQKNEPLHELLRSVYVESTDPAATAEALKEAPEALQSERRPTRVHIPGHAYGLTNVPKGKLTIAEAVKALGSHQHQPQTWTPEKIAQEYFLDFKDTKAALEFFVPFKVEIIPPKTRTANQIKAS
uniref:NADH dehydrogenase [ubiquinone] 1 alpha subcomplex assembly factor 4 n=1 Tax=Oryzias latipes TaxID=8090 RepID=A0A3P9MCX2_ORYLA